MSVKHFFLLILTVTAATGARAQSAANDTVLRGSTIEVIQAYKPEVKQAPKPEWIPQLPPADTTHPNLNIEVPQQSLYYTYSSEPLRPLALGKEIPQPPFQSYIKAGYGNLSTLFLDAGTNAISGEDYETAIHLHHMSQTGEITNQQSALSGAEADGFYHADKNDWHASIQAERNQYYYYGYDHSQYEYPADSVKQVYTTIRGTVDLKNTADSTGRLQYHPAITGSLYDAKINASEVTGGLNVPITYRLDSSLDLTGTVTGIITDYKTNIWASYNNFAQIAPGIGLHHGLMSGHAILGFAVGSDGTGYVLPDVLAAFNLPDTRYIVTAGWQSSIRRNTFEELSTENPYVFVNYNIEQTRKDEAFLGLSGTVGDHFIFTARGSWYNFSNLPVYLNDQGDQKQFYVAYDNVKALGLHVEIRYTAANILSIGATSDYYKYYDGTQLYAWQEPNVKLKSDVTVTPSPKFMVTAYITIMTGMHARDTLQNVIAMKPIVDAGCNAEYQIIRRLSAFAQINNLLNDKYQRWYGYNAYGLNIYGGVRLKF